jgi:hypothetical protein
LNGYLGRITDGYAGKGKSNGGVFFNIQQTVWDNYEKILTLPMWILNATFLISLLVLIVFLNSIVHLAFIIIRAQKSH